MEDNNGKGTLAAKSFAFAIRIVNAYKFLVNNNEYVLSKQLLRAGTSVGANCREAKNAQSRQDFINKLNIALKEADETSYWLELLYEADYLDKTAYNSINKDCVELIKLLTSIIKTTKNTPAE